MTTTQAVVTAPGVVRHRYPGVHSFEEPDSDCFFGRSKATEELLLRVLSVRLLLQFAPSGAGKTSLLNAGLFPRLRPHGYLPAIVRLNRADESLVAAVARSLRDEASRSHVDDPVIPEAAGTVWDLLAGTQLWTRELLLLTPVLVFDQFEEVFTLRDETFRRQFATEIGELSRGARTGVNRDGQTAPDVKIVISLREEYLGALEEMTVAIPDLFRERLRLPPLTSDEAKEAIVEPARLPGDWLSPQFEFDRDCLDGLIDFIDGVSERVHVIEPLTLQLVCQRAEAIALARSGEARPTLTLENFGGPSGLEDLVHRYYQEQLDQIADRRTRQRATAMFEQGLLDPSGKRLMLEQDEIHRQYGIDAAVLGTLVEGRLLRREPRSESIFYEISHDRLTDVIARNRPARLPRWVRPAPAIAALLIVVLTAAILFVLGAKREADAARRSTANALNVLFGDVLGARLTEAGLSDALEQVIGLTKLEPNVDPLAHASQLRRLGELQFERDAGSTAQTTLTKALSTIDEAVARAGTSKPFGRERAHVLKDLGDVLMDQGQVSQAEARYTEAVELWNEAIKTNPDPDTRLGAVQAQTALGGAWQRLGDIARSGDAYADAAARAVEVLTATYRQGFVQGADSAFLIGRAVHIYADAALAMAIVRWDSEGFKRARAAANAAMQLRPLSAEARIQLGTASAYYGTALADTGDWVSAQRVFDESKRQFSELTQFDPRNRLMRRELAAERLVTAEVVGRCADNRECRKGLQPGLLEAAETSALISIGAFLELAEQNPASRSLRDDVAWGKQVQAQLMRSRGAGAEALPLLDEALAIRRPNVVDQRDVVSRAAVVSLLAAKAAALNDTGRRAEALATIEEARKAAEQLPSAEWRRGRLLDCLNTKEEVLVAIGRTQEAGAVRGEREALQRSVGTAQPARDTKALALNEDGNRLFEAASRAGDPDKARQYDLAAEKYRAALAQAPMDPVIWSNLRDACARAADSRDTANAGAAPSDALAGRVESNRRCALESGWIAWILTDDGTKNGERATRLRTVYEDRRSLAMLLRNDKQHLPEALALAEQGVREAEELLEADSSPGTLYLVADSYYGLAMMREESGREGWEQALRTAILRGEQLRNKEPAAVAHRIWVGRARLHLAQRLDAWKRPGGAHEQELAHRDCQEALRIAKSADDRAAAQSCLAEVQR